MCSFNSLQSSALVAVLCNNNKDDKKRCYVSVHTCASSMICKSAAIVPFTPGIGIPSRRFSDTSSARLSAAFAVLSDSFFVMDAPRYCRPVAGSANLVNRLKGCGRSSSRLSEPALDGRWSVEAYPVSMIGETLKGNLGAPFSRSPDHRRTIFGICIYLLPDIIQRDWPPLSDS